LLPLLASVALVLPFLSSCSSESSRNGGSGSAESTSGGAAPAAFLPAGAVLPTDETVASNQYTPLSRPLYIYVSKKSLAKPAVAAFLQYYLSDEGMQLVAETGYVRLSEQEISATRDRLQTALQEAGLTAPSPDLTGDVVIDGSSTVLPISAAVAEEFSRQFRGVRVPVGKSGTGGGFKKFAAGEIDISDASRPIKDSEKAACEAGGIEWVELKIAIDGLTVVVSPENDWVDGLTVAQLKQIWEPGSKVEKWSDVDPAWPAEKMSLFGPGTDSGTFDYFTEAVCGETGASRSDYQASEDDNDLVKGVAGNKYALGYFGYAYYVSNKDQIKALAIAP
jgi:phosphate binding protein